ncbi:unnamed protein product [Leptidea sinapis]|uniref:Protein amnionless n=1 Tax=Leptidea sinapis TaxID=189913 RepID=A0A5E4QSW5_9NEOP|nr:unnamed protein product [Leptidea sinapis]
MFSTVYVTLFYLINISLTEKVTWLPNTNFNSPLNFKDGKIPCSKQNVIFPDTLNGIINLESDISVNSFILPIDGELLISDGVIMLGPGNDNCTETGNAYFLEKSVSSWAQAGVWSSPKFNEATPDAERVPCFDDVVEFPENSVFTVVLPEREQVVKSVKIRGVTYNYNGLGFLKATHDPSQQFVLPLTNYYFNFNTVKIINNVQCQSRSGCPCQDNFLKIDCSVKFCSVPTCMDPIQPIGHCCKICGGVTVFDVDQSFDLMEFHEFVEKIVQSYDKDKLIVHVGRLKNKIQLVVVEKGDYTGMSAEVAYFIDRWLPKHWGNGLRQTLISGSPRDSYGQSGKIIYLSILCVVLVFAGIYLYYYKLPALRYPLIGGIGLSRYQRRSDSVVSLTRRDSIVSTGTQRRAAFRNPLYDSRRGRVIVEETSSDY